MKYLFIGLLLVFLIPSISHAQTGLQCFPYKALKEAGKSEFGSVPMWSGDMDNALEDQLELWLNPDGSHWAVILVRPLTENLKLGCILGSGKGHRPLKQEKKDGSR